MQTQKEIAAEEKYRQLKIEMKRLCDGINTNIHRYMSDSLFGVGGNDRVEYITGYMQGAKFVSEEVQKAIDRFDPGCVRARKAYIAQYLEEVAERMSVMPGATRFLRVMTNIENIRVMTNKELAELLSEGVDEMTIREHCVRKHRCTEDCRHCRFGFECWLEARVQAEVTIDVTDIKRLEG